MTSASIMEKYAYLVDEVKSMIFVMLAFCYGFIPFWSYLETTEWGSKYVFGPQWINLATLVTMMLWYAIMCGYHLPDELTISKSQQQFIRALLNFASLICLAAITLMWKHNREPTCTRFMCAYFGPRCPWLTLTSNLVFAAMSRCTVNLALGTSSVFSLALEKYWDSKGSICIKKETQKAYYCHV